MVPKGGPYVKGHRVKGDYRGRMLRRLLLLALLVGTGLAVRRLLLSHQDVAVGSPDHWPAVPKKETAPEKVAPTG